MTWDKQGYDTDKPCDVCGHEGDNMIEPRYGYVVCEQHKDVSPIEVSHTKQRQTGGLTREKKEIFKQYKGSASRSIRDSMSEGNESE